MHAFSRAKPNLNLVPLQLADHGTEVTAAHVRGGHLGSLCNTFRNLQGAVVSAALHKHARGSIAALARITVMSTEMSHVWGSVREFVGGPEAIFDAASDGAFIGIGED